MKQPEIRFNGFSDEWEDVVLKDTMSKISLKNKDLDVTYVESISNTKGFIPQTSQFGDRLVASKDLSNYTIVTEGDIAYNPSRINVGSIALKDAGSSMSVISPLYVAFRVKDDMLSPQFLMNWLNTTKFDRQRSNASEGGVRDTLSYGSFSKFKIQLPTLPEQQKIGTLFSKYDAIIALREQKLEELNALKKGLLQQMFPKNGVKVPELRFTGFVDDWVERKLGEHTELITKGTTPKDKTGVGDVNFVKVENITNGEIYPINKIKQHEHDNYLKRSQLEEKDILFSIAGTLGRTAIVNKLILPANTNQALAIIRGYDFDPNFLITSLTGNVVKEYIRRNPTVGAQPNLSLKQVGNLLVNTPNAEEQQKIGKLFKQLDARISNEQTKIEQLKAQKQGLLQRMI